MAMATAAAAISSRESSTFAATWDCVEGDGPTWLVRDAFE
jgi:hypothetical protein